MITAQETTSWDDSTPNHKYILSDDMRYAYGYIKIGDTYPSLFKSPMEIDKRYRQFKVLVRTVDDDNAQRWIVEGSKGNKYKVSLKHGQYSCTCPASTFKSGDCKHIRQIKESM